MKKNIFWLVFWVILGVVVVMTPSVCAASLTATELTTKIIQTADANTSSRESLVQWYYSVEDLYNRVKKISETHPQLARLEIVKTNLRKEIDTRKNALTKTTINTFYANNQSYLSGTTGLSSLCKNNYQIADDWSYAFDLPTPLVLATRDIESSCGRYHPSNGDGIFQLVAKEYGSSDNFTMWNWIVMMYDYVALVQSKIAWYHTSNSLSKDTCSSKDTTTLGQTAPICLSYTLLDLDSLVKYGALYNGLSGWVIKWNIQPANPNYVFGKFGSAYQSASKDWIIMRVLKVLQYKQ